MEDPLSPQRLTDFLEEGEEHYREVMSLPLSSFLSQYSVRPLFFSFFSPTSFSQYPQSSIQRIDANISRTIF